MSEAIILSVAAGLVIFEYQRSSKKGDIEQAEKDQEKCELKEKVDSLAIAMEKQSAQLQEMSRITIGLRDDLEKANKKNSGFLGFGSGNEEKPPEIKEVSNSVDTVDCHFKPITKAVLKMNLHSV